METKLVQRFGNGGHIVLPKEYVGRRIRFLTEPKTFEDIKSEIFEILKPHLEKILGIYLYGSYARNEQTVSSDIDILIVTNEKFKINNKLDNYSIVSVTIKEIEETLDKNAILILPIIKETETIINPDLLVNYKNYNFTKKNTKLFMDSTVETLKLNKKGLELDFEIGSLVYSLILRIRGLLIIKLLIVKKLFSKMSLFGHLEKNNIEKEKISELYIIYCRERDNIKVKESDIIGKTEIEKLLTIAEKLLKDIKF